MRALGPFTNLANYFAEQIQSEERESSKCYEPMIGIVTDNKDPSKLGRVKLKLPVLSDKDETYWCPIIMLGAGKNRGWFFIPEVNDEVLVMFEHGDLDRPIVVGALWNGKDKPSDKNPGGVPRRSIKSRAGSQIIFDDEKGTITVSDGAGKGKIVIDKANKIGIQALDGDVCIQAPAGDLLITAKDIEITASTNVEIYSGAAMKWSAASNGTIKSSATTLSGAKENNNCGVASDAAKATASPADVADPFGS